MSFAMVNLPTLVSDLCEKTKYHYVFEKHSHPSNHLWYKYYWGDYEQSRVTVREPKTKTCEKRICDY
jgi:hypothetical protein